MGSSSSNSTSQKVDSVDRRQALDNSVGISGDGSSIDLSNRSVNYNISTDQGAIAGAVDILKSSIDANKSAFQTYADNLAGGQKNALDFGVHVTDSAFASVKQANDSTAEVARIAMANNADAWNNAKTGNGLGDMKYVLYAFAAVFGLMMWKRG